MGVLTDDQIKEIYTLRMEDKMTIADLAKRFHCSMPTIHKAIHSLSGEELKSKRLNGERLERLIARYKEDHPPLSVMAKEFDVTKATIRNALVRTGVYEEQNRSLGKSLSPEEEAAFIRDYQANKTLRSLTKKYDRSEYILKQILEKYPDVNRQGEKKWSDKELQENEEIVKLYAEGKTVAELSRLYHRNEGPILTLLKHAGVDVVSEQTRRKVIRQQEREKERFQKRFKQMARVPRHYEIECSDHDDAIDLHEQIAESMKSHPYEKDARFTINENTLLLDGEFTFGFHRMMLSQYVDVDD